MTAADKLDRLDNHAARRMHISEWQHLRMLALAEGDSRTVTECDYRIAKLPRRRFGKESDMSSPATVATIDVEFWSGAIRPYRAVVRVGDRRVGTTGGCKSPSNAIHAAKIIAGRFEWDSLTVYNPARPAVTP